MEFADHFSGHSPDYRRYRPGYPRELFAWLADQAPARGLAWDAGTGSGQSAIGVAGHFDCVIASDPSSAQLENAEAHARVCYRVAAEELAELGAGTVDLVTVAQALHWFNFDRFFAEVRRVLKPGGLFAAWAYNHSRIAPEIDPLVRRFQEETVGPYWAPERAYVDRGYEQIPFPFDPLAAPAFAARHDWNARHFLEYLRTWSSVKAFQRKNGFDPVDEFAPGFLAAWGDAARARAVRFPLVLRAGRSG
jgi:SAM-dependent methyltransferase